MVKLLITLMVLMGISTGLSANPLHLQCYVSGHKLDDVKDTWNTITDTLDVSLSDGFTSIYSHNHRILGGSISTVDNGREYGAHHNSSQGYSGYYSYNSRDYSTPEKIGSIRVVEVLDVSISHSGHIKLEARKFAAKVLKKDLNALHNISATVSGHCIKSKSILN